MPTSISKLHQKILRQRGLGKAEKFTKKPLSHDKVQRPYGKTALMMLLESRYQVPIEELIKDGTIYECGKRLGLNPTTIYKWRTIIKKANDKEFWRQFGVTVPDPAVGTSAKKEGPENGTKTQRPTCTPEANSAVPDRAPPSPMLLLQPTIHGRGLP